MQTTLFDTQSGYELATHGMNTATAHADAMHDDWSDRAYDCLLTFIRSKSGTFLAEDVREYAQMSSLPVPPSNRAWGGVMVRARNAGMIRRVGFAQVKNARAHCANAGLWEKC